MTMFFSSLPTNPFDLASWVWRNREQLPSMPLEAADLVQRTVENGGEGIRRIGSSIVFGTQDGGQQVLAFIDQVPQQLDALKTSHDAIRSSLGALEAGQQAIGSSLASLHTLSTVSLGVAALSPVLLSSQFFWLRGQFKSIHRRLDRLEKLIDDQTVSRLKAGLDALESGTKKQNKSRINDAFVPCNEALHTFSSRLEDLLAETPKRQDRKMILHLTQHLSVAICAAARCDVAIGHDENAESTLARHRPVLVRSAKAIFEQTVEKIPGRFLKPKLTDDNSGVEFLRTLVLQARDTEILPKDHSLVEASQSLPTFVDYLLGEARSERFFRSNSLEKLRDELRDATVSLEDTSRVLSLQSMIDKAKQTKMSTQEMIDYVELEKENATSPFVAWAV